MYADARLTVLVKLYKKQGVKIVVYDGIEYEDCINSWIAVKNVSNFNSQLRIPPTIGKKNVVAIADHVFADNDRLEVVAIPATITEIGNYAFAGCKNLKSVKEIECRCASAYKGLTLNKCAFQDCKELKEILLSSWIMLRGEKIFQRCHKLETIGVTGENKVFGSIPHQCFQACVSLPHLTISKPTCVVSNNAFNWCSNLKTITFISHNVMCEDEDTWNSLYRAKLRCLPNCNLTELSYDGVEVEVFEDDEVF